MTVHSPPERPDRGDRGDRGGDKRERILLAAERIFARHGFFAARVSEIAKEAGVADGTIYLYFKSKDDLLISLFENRMKQVN
ncbi:MAG TPA: helix-turn-helix domain-containing protein, partial [Kofleriaceae bacterium]